MIFDIIKTINGRIKLCLQPASGEYYFVEKINVDNTEEISFTDKITNSFIVVKKEDFDNVSITTFGSNTIPNLPIIKAYNSGDDSFFVENSEDHILANEKFDNMVNMCNEYKKLFGDKNIFEIKRCVIENNIAELEKLKILGSDRFVVFSQISTPDRVYIRSLYWELVETHLSCAINEINESMKDMDEEFKADAEIIKNDLIKNVDDFKIHMKGVTFDKLFNQWPTLLNPSPFNNAT